MSKSIQSFWWYWLVAVTIGVIVFGLAFVVIPDVMNNFLNWLLFSASSKPTSFDRPATSYITFVYSILGAVMAGWAVALLHIVVGPFRRGESWTWQALTSSIVVWFVLDSGASLAAGFGENAIFNLVFFGLFSVPLAATYRHFHPARRRVT